MWIVLALFINWSHLFPNPEFSVFSKSASDGCEDCKMWGSFCSQRNQLDLFLSKRRSRLPLTLPRGDQAKLIILVFKNYFHSLEIILVVIILLEVIVTNNCANDYLSQSCHRANDLLSAREYFEPDAPEINKIPTVNTNLSSEQVILCFFMMCFPGWP